MPARLPFTGNDQADALVSEDPLALLIGFAVGALYGLVLIARFVGSRRHGGEGDEGDEIGAASGPATEPGP